MTSWRPNRLWRSKPPPRRRRSVWVSVIVGVVVEGGATWLRSRRLGGNLPVRCRQGHLFTTIWIPAVSVKALRLGWWRFQHCPVGHHWAIVTPVREDELSDEERQIARSRHDIRIP